MHSFLIAQLSGLTVVLLETGAYSPWRSAVQLELAGSLAGSIKLKQRKTKSPHDSHTNEDKSPHAGSAGAHFMIFFNRNWRTASTPS